MQAAWIDARVRNAHHTHVSTEGKRQQLQAALLRVADGDRASLKLVYDLTSARLLGTILHILRDRDTSEDVLQDVYLKVWRRAGRYDAAKAGAMTWLSAIARNAAIDVLRRQGRLPMSSDDGLDQVADDAPDAAEMLCSEEDRERLRLCLEQLKNDQRHPIRLAYFRGFTHSELAQRLNVPLGTIKSRIRRGLASLKGCLADG